MRLFSFAALWLIGGGGLLGCGAPSSGGLTAHPGPKSAAAKSPTSSSSPTPPSSAPSPPKPPPGEAAIYARLESELTLCYERGRKAVPAMLDGKLTLNASIDADGKTTCVIPTEDKGLTQEVEDCMSAAFAKERFDPGSPWTASIPVAVRGGTVQLGTRAADVGIDSVETHRMADAFEALEALVPELQTCVRELDRSSGLRSVMVGARVAVNGRTQCALATGSPVALPAKTAECTVNAFRRTQFPPPSGGPGLILVPIAIMRGK